MTHPVNMARIAVAVGRLHSAHLQGVDAVRFGVQGFNAWDWVSVLTQIHK